MFFKPRQQEGMRYDQIHHCYPWIEELFALVAGQVHAGSTPDMSIGYLDQRDRRIAERVIKEHRKDVRAKLASFAQILWDNDHTDDDTDDEEEPLPPPQINNIPPELCTYCGSVDTDGSCRWCRTANNSTSERSIPMLNQAIGKLTNEQAQLKHSSGEYAVSKTLIYLCQYLPTLAAAIAGSDKTVKDCYKHLRDYAIRNKTGNCVVIEPETTIQLICEFYGVDPVDLSKLQSTALYPGLATPPSAVPATPAPPAPAPATPTPAPNNTVNILDFLDMD